MESSTKEDGIGDGIGAPEEFGIRRIGQVSLPVNDLDAAVLFYRDVLGMPFLFRTPAMAFFDCSGIRLMLTVPEKPERDHRASILYFRVDDIDGVHETLDERGVEFEDGPQLIADMGDHELWMAFFHDTADNVLALMSEVPKDG